MPLSERVRIEVYLPELPRTAYQDLLVAIEHELTYTFGGCTTIRGVEGNYLSRAGAVIRDRINIVYTDTPLSLGEHVVAIDRYAAELNRAAMEALEEEAVLISVMRVQHAS